MLWPYNAIKLPQFYNSFLYLLPGVGLTLLASASASSFWPRPHGSGLGPILGLKNLASFDVTSAAADDDDGRNGGEMISARAKMTLSSDVKIWPGGLRQLSLWCVTLRYYRNRQATNCRANAFAVHRRFVYTDFLQPQNEPIFAPHATSWRKSPFQVKTCFESRPRGLNKFRAKWCYRSEFITPKHAVFKKLPVFLFYRF